MIAWETTTEDVLNVLEDQGVEIDVDMEEHKVDEIHSRLDHAAIEKAALYGNDIETQTDYAYEEIVRQLREMGEIE